MKIIVKEVKKFKSFMYFFVHQTYSKSLAQFGYSQLQFNHIIGHITYQYFRLSKLFDVDPLLSITMGWKYFWTIIYFLCSPYWWYIPDKKQSKLKKCLLEIINSDAKDSICNSAGLQAVSASAEVLPHSEHSL